MAGKLNIVPFVNKKGENRFKVVGSKGNTFLDAFGYGFYTKNSAYSGILLFAKYHCNKKRN